MGSGVTSEAHLKKMAEAVVVNSIEHMRTVSFTLGAENEGEGIDEK